MSSTTSTNTTVYIDIVANQPIDVQDVITRCTRPDCGAVSTFLGTTRNTFEGKTVVELVYDAYVPMAKREMESIAREIINNNKGHVLAVGMVHRTGVVPVGEASVVIVVSSVHRSEGLTALHWAVDELKARVPVFKKEVYEDGSVWKQNPEQFVEGQRRSCCNH
eukprot:PhM_4_TR18291/c0_g2_i1/m.3223/K03635/MOCS2B, moaE; molybdopterin synthase catalytic subunit